MGVASRSGWALDWSVIIVKGAAWIMYSDWRRDTTHTHAHTHGRTQVSGPTGCFIHNLALPLLLSSSALFGLDCVWKSETWWATLCCTWMLNSDQLVDAHKRRHLYYVGSQTPTHTHRHTHTHTHTYRMTHVLSSCRMPCSRIRACKQL